MAGQNGLNCARIPSHSSAQEADRRWRRGWEVRFGAYSWDCATPALDVKAFVNDAMFCPATEIGQVVAFFGLFVVDPAVAVDAPPITVWSG